MRIAFFGSSITSSRGNGHAASYRVLFRELTRRGHEVLFCERDVPWSASARDLTHPPWGRTSRYGSLEELRERHGEDVAAADLVIVGSDLPEGVAVCHWVLERAGCAVAFYDVDTPVTLAELRRGECDYLAPEQVGRFDLYLSCTGGPTLRVLEEEMGAQRAIAFYGLADPETCRPVPAGVRWDLGYLGSYSEDRQPLLQRLLIEPARRAPQMRFVVAGPRYPEEIAWPPNVERIERLAPEQHPTFYAAQRFSLNLTRAEMREAGWSPSMRLFEAAACGTPVISDGWPGLEQIFAPDEEILIADRGTDVLDFLDEAGERERAEIASRARARVLAEYTAEQRCGLLEEEVSRVAAR